MNKFTAIITISIFIISSIVLGILSVEIYKMSAASDISNEINAASSYFTETFKECEDTSTLRTASVSGEIPAVVTKQGTEEIWYFTYDGYLKKLHCTKGDTVLPENGQNIMPMQNSDFTLLRENLLKISFCTENGQVSYVNIFLFDRKGGSQ